MLRTAWIRGVLATDLAKVALSYEGSGLKARRDSQALAMEFRYGDPVHPVTPGGAPKPTFHPACLTCGYDLRRSKLDRCPECGNTFVYREWERAVRDVKSRITETEELLWWSNRAWIIAIARRGHAGGLPDPRSGSRDEDHAAWSGVAMRGRRLPVGSQLLPAEPHPGMGCGTPDRSTELRLGVRRLARRNRRGDSLLIMP